MDFAFNIAFIVEATMKIVALGVWNEPTAYFRRSWNWLDFVVTVVSTCSLCIGHLLRFGCRRPSSSYSLLCLSMHSVAQYRCSHLANRFKWRE